MPMWTPTNTGGMKAIVCRASDLKIGDTSKLAYVELSDLNSLRLLLMHVENPLVISFAAEEDAPAEVEIMVYDDSIEL